MSPARQLRRARRLGRDLVAVVGAFGRTLSWIVRPRPDQPGIAMLQGDPLARVGTTSTYRVRACNPSERLQPVRIVVLGWLEGVPEAPGARFRVEWSDALEPGAVSERWIRTCWCGDVEVLPAAPLDASLWYAQPVVGRWHVEARVPDAAGSPALRACGVVVR